MSENGDYISREMVIERLEKLFHLQKTTARAIIEAIPAADVRPVVLCRDCEYYFKDEDGYEMCDNSEGYDNVSEDGFCAWGKKREES